MRTTWDAAAASDRVEHYVGDPATARSELLKRTYARVHAATSIAIRALEDIAKASGGMSYFPENVADVKTICEQVAHDIRNQYTLAYYPTNTKRDGTFRAVQVEVVPPRGRGRLVARTRNGYYAPGPSPSGSARGPETARLVSSLSLN